MGSKNFSLLFLLLVFSLFSCSDQAPKLAVVFPQVIYDVEEEVFSFFLEEAKDVTIKVDKGSVYVAAEDAQQQQQTQK